MERVEKCLVKSVVDKKKERKKIKKKRKSKKKVFKKLELHQVVPDERKRDRNGRWRRTLGATTMVKLLL